jgi:imidazolonepropionase-like amidohydrolase
LKFYSLYRALCLSLLSAGFICVGGLFLVTPAVAQADGPVLAIRGGTLLDGNGGEPVANAVVLIRGNRIWAVGAADEVQIPAGATIIDATGKWITPGLIDAKANWNWMYGEAFLHYGVTSAMVSGARNDAGIAERDAINHGIYPGPRLYQVVLNATGGGADHNDPAFQRQYGMARDNYVPGSGRRTINTPEEARALARANIAGGADFLGTNDGAAPQDVWAAYADEAHKAGKAVVMRCVGPLTRGRECVLAGADVMIHTGEIGNQIARHPEVWEEWVGEPSEPYCDMDEDKEREMIAFLLQHDAAPEPDFIAMDRGLPSNWARVQQEARDVFDDPNLRAYYPRFAMEDLWDNVKSPEEYMEPGRVSLRRCGFMNHAKFIGDLIAAGGHAVVASDITQAAPGLGVHQEMAVFQEDAHVPPMKVLQAATSWTAHHFKIDDIGSVEVGKLADILIVNADPAEDILNMREIDTLIKDGVVVDRSYHADYRGGMFANSMTSFDNLVVSDPEWVAALKKLTVLPEPRVISTFTAPNGEVVNIQAGLSDFRRMPGIGPVPNPTMSLTPAIETLFPHTVIQGAPDTEFTLTGFNFNTRSVVYLDGNPVPTTVKSGTELTFLVSADVLAEAGKRHLVVKNPEPLGLGMTIWGDTSNEAHILVPFSFTTAWSHNTY